MIASPSTDLPALVDRKHPVAVAVEGHAEVAAFAADGLLQQPEVGRAAADVDVRPVGLVSDRDDVAPSSVNAFGAMPEYAPFAQSTAIVSFERSLPNRSTTWRE